MTEPETRYAVTVDGVHIAYQEHGTGPLDVVWIHGFTANVEMDVELDHRWARMLARMASRWRVIVFDKRGTGLSDRQQTPDLENRADDLRAVLDALDVRSAVLCGHAEGGALAAFFAATYPDRVTALILLNAFARAAWAPDYPNGVTEQEFLADRSRMATAWGTVEYAREWAAAEAPSVADDQQFLKASARSMRHSASPGAALEFYDIWYATDVRAILGTIQAPTLMISRPDAEGSVGEPATVAAVADHMAERIPGAVHVQVPGRDFVPWIGDGDAIVDEIDRFLRRQRAEQEEFNRVLATVLFTDIVESTETMATIGDRGWKQLVERHHETVRALLGRYRGVELDTAGDGFYASFDGPARAVRCGRAITDAMPRLGLQVRAGVHTGEVELIDGKPAGMAVNIGARIAARASAHEVLVSQTVKDLVVGSGLGFDERGTAELKGVPGEWKLWAATD
jgi:pimeloyl-ACP methyl ester carboxylesterase/class 3 adenylate cyclase